MVASQLGYGSGGLGYSYNSATPSLAYGSDAPGFNYGSSAPIFGYGSSAPAADPTASWNQAALASALSTMMLQ